MYDLELMDSIISISFPLPLFLLPSPCPLLIITNYNEPPDNRSLLLVSPAFNPVSRLLGIYIMHMLSYVYKDVCIDILCNTISTTSLETS